MDKEFEELKALFQHRKTSVTLSATLVDRKAKGQLKGLKKNHIMNIVSFIATAFAIILVDSINAQKMETSIMGFWILIGCSLYYAISKGFLLYKLNQIKVGESVLDTIQRLEAYKKLNIWLHTYGEVIYALVLGLGVYLYLRPVLDKFLLDKTGHTVLCFWWIWGAFLLWMVFYTFVIKRRRMRKDVHVLESYIQSLKSEQ